MPFRRRRALAGSCLVLLFAFTACDSLPPELRQQLRGPLAAVRKALGLPAPTGAAKAPAAPLNDEQKATQAQAEVLAEVLRVVLMGEPRNVREFNMILSTLHQGASVEGLYNGFTRSSGFRSLERRSGAAPKHAVDVFAEELAFLEKELPKPTEFDAESAKPLPVFDPRGEDLSDAPKPPLASPAPTKPVAGAARPAPSVSPAAPGAADYAKLFANSSIFTLKRVLGEEAMKLVASKKNSPDDLARWYAIWVTRLNQKKIDFGHPDRNRDDTDFHLKWAMLAIRARPDAFLWEVLNRVHRVMNEAARPAGT